MSYGAIIMMKWLKLTSLLATLVLAAVPGASAQGRINFETEALLRHAGDGSVVNGSGFLAQLYVGTEPDPHQMEPVGGVVLVGANGRLATPSPNYRTLSGIPAGSTIHAQIRTWHQEDNFSFAAVLEQGGRIGFSPVFQVQTSTDPQGLLNPGGPIHVHEVTGNLVEPGKILFSNREFGLDVPFFDEGGNFLEGENFVAQLYAGASPELLNPVSGLRHFGTGTGAGYLIGGEAEVQTPLVHPGQTAYIKICVWDRAWGPSYENAKRTRGAVGESNIISVLAGGGFFPEWPVPRLMGLEPVRLSRAETPPQYGSVHFSNRIYVPSLEEIREFRVFLPDGTTPVSGPDFRARLYAGFDPFDLQPVGWSRPFMAGTNAGLWEPEIKLIPGVTPGARIFVQVRIWDQTLAQSHEEATSRLALRGESKVMEITTGGSGTPPELPAVLDRLEEIVLYRGSSPVLLSEPSSLSLVEGSPLDLRIEFQASEPYTITWFKDGSAVPGATGASLQFGSSTMDLSGTYFARVENEAGAISTSPFVINIDKRIDPPAVTGVSGDQTVVKGTSAALEVSFTGTSPVKVDWLLNGKMLIPGGGPSITLGDISAEFAGVYTAVLSNSAGEARATVGAVTVLEPLSWARLPESRSIRSGESVTFSALAKGTDPIQYTWFFNGVRYPVSGPTLSIGEATPDQSGSFRVTASNAVGEITSPVFSLEVLERPAITIQPEDVILAQGSPLQLTAGAKGSEPLAYQWFRDGQPLAGAKSPTLSIPQAGEEHEGFYHLTVYNAVGEDSTRVITVEIGKAPEIAFQPAPVSTPAGRASLFWLEAEGDGPLEYRWMSEATTLLTTGDPWIILNSVPEQADGLVRVVVSNEYGSTTSEPFSTRMIQPLDLPETEAPALQRVFPSGVSQSGPFPVVLALRNLKGGPVSISESIAPELEVHGVADGGNWDPESRMITWNLPVSDELVVHYTAQRKTPGNQPVGFAGKVRQGELELDSRLEPLEWASVPESQTIASGTSTTFSARAAGSGPIRYSWYFNGVKYPGEGPNLAITRATADQSGGYRVTATNGAGEISSPVFTLDVVDPPVMLAEPQDVILAGGSSLQLNARVGGSAPMAFQWFKDGTPVAGANEVALSIPAATRVHEGGYHLTASNRAGEVSSRTVSVKIGNAPQIVFQPSPVSTPAGRSAVFWVEAIGDSPMSYQWMWEGASLLTTQQPWIILDALPEESVGRIQVKISNNIGSTTSEPFGTRMIKPLELPEVQGPAVQRILPQNIPATEAFPVILALRNLMGLPIRLDEVIAPDVEVVEIADGGIWDPENRLITWKLPVSDELIVHYTLRRTEATDQPVAFAGKAYHGDLELDISGKSVIGGFPPMPADVQPMDYRISLQEMQDYIGTFLTGEPWIDNSVITLSEAVRTVAIRNQGGAYLFNPSLRRPMAWIPKNNFFGDRTSVQNDGTAGVPSVHFVGQTDQDQFVIQLILDIPARQAFACGVELELSEGWSWDASDPDAREARWIFPSAQQRKLLVDIFPVAESATPAVDVSGFVSYDGDIIPLKASATLVDPLPNSISSATMQPDGNFVIKGITEIGGSWLIEKTTDFKSWTPWRQFESGAGEFTVQGRVEQEPEGFFRIRYVQDENIQTIQPVPNR